MNYPKTCSACGIESTPEDKFCPQCGIEKAELVTKVKFFDSVVNDISAKLTFLDNPEIFVRIVFKLTILLLAGLLLPAFIKQSEFVWMILLAYSIFGIVKEIEFRIERITGIYLYSQALFYAYIGAGFGNLISYTGRNYYYNIGYYFNIKFIASEIGRLNALPLIGAIAGIGLFVFIRVIKKMFEESD
jgi:hypothetical protein